jgi:tetratricopeptide (TPR) repeat protein/DNA-binding XRE family transcriptional regulator
MKVNMPDDQETPFFGDLLKSSRQRKHFTQQQLAKLIGVNRDSIGSWERGEFFPETPTMLHEIARVLDLGEDEKRLLFEALYGTASMLPLHNFPEHNPYFTGRKVILTQLHAQLTAGKSVALIQTQAISGLGGIGKTQVAIEYAYRYREHYHDILWASSDSRETLMTSYLTLARLLRLPEREEREQHKVIEAVKRWLREHKGWLLILDDIEDLSLVQEFVPTPRQGAVILTTRQGETIPLAKALVLEVLPEEEGSLFLLRRSGYLPRESTLETASADNRKAALAIVQAVVGLPLALDQAGAYIAETKCSLSDYLRLFKQRQTALLQRRGTLSLDHPLSVTATFSLAFEQVQQKNEAAIELLKLCAYLSPGTIPLELITQGAVHLGTVSKEVTTDALQLDQALETLQAYSLVRRDGESGTLSIHRLVQIVLQNKLEEAEQHYWAEHTVLTVNAVFPHADEVNWPQCERLLPHALIAAQYIETEHISGEEAGRLLHETATYLQGRARDSEAETFYLLALSIFEQALGVEHPQVASLLNGLADLYTYQGKYKQAEPHHQRAIRILEQALGPEHPDLASPLDGLGCLYTKQGKYEQAEPLYQRVLDIRERSLGPEHPLVAQPLYNLAGLDYLWGEYERAGSLLQRALHILEQALGPEHLHVTYPLEGLAEVYSQQGKYTEAEPLLQRALHIREQVLGPEHPQVAYLLNIFANLYREKGRYGEAEPLLQRALHIREQAQGPKHPETADVIHDFALLREAQGRKDAAKVSYENALTIREQKLGASHPKTIETRNRLISLLHCMEQHEEAIQLERSQSEQGMDEKEHKTLSKK